MITQAITFRWIEGDELDILTPLLELRGWKPLNKDLSRAYCAFDGDLLVGFMVSQMVVHAGPLLIDPEYRGQLVAEQLAVETVRMWKHLQAGDMLVIPENRFSEALCQEFGLEQVASPVYLLKR